MVSMVTSPPSTFRWLSDAVRLDVAPFTGSSADESLPVFRVPLTSAPSGVEERSRLDRLTVGIPPGESTDCGLARGSRPVKVLRGSTLELRVSGTRLFLAVDGPDAGSILTNPVSVNIDRWSRFPPI